VTARDTWEAARSALAAKRALIDRYDKVTVGNPLTLAAAADYLPLLEIADGVLDEHGPHLSVVGNSGTRHYFCACEALWPCAFVRPVLTFAGVEVGA
jgi:hypothetical protein